MRVRQVLCAPLGLLLVGALLWAGEPWKEKPYTEWTQPEAERMLSNSPWAVQVTHSWSSPTRDRVDTTMMGTHTTTTYCWGGSENQPPKCETFIEVGRLSVTTDSVQSSTRSRVLWYSSVTIREAMVRLNFLRASITEDQAKELISWKPEHYVVMVSGYTALVLRGLSDAQLKKSVSLRLKRSRQRIAPVLIQRGGSELLLYFPRELEGKPLISPEEDKAEFQCKAGVCKAGVQLKVKFDLRQMTRNGQPDL